MDSLVIRPAVPADAGALREIYRWYVEKTAVTFEYETPTAEEFRARMDAVLSFYPFLVAEDAGGIVGYACAGRFHPRAAYGWCAETTIYLRADRRGRGLGRLLYAALEEALSKMGVVNLYACIAEPAAEDEFLTGASARFHERLGYRRIGTFRSCGFKFGRWYDMIWMEKLIGDHRPDPPPVRPFPESGD